MKLSARLPLLLTLSCATTDPAATDTSAEKQATAPSSTSPPASTVQPDALPSVVAWKDATTIAAECEERRTRIGVARDRVKAATEKTEAAVLVHENHMLTELDSAVGLMQLMANVHPDKPTRDAAEKCEQSLKQLASEINLDRALYETIAAVDSSALDPEVKRFVDKVLREFRRAGVDKDEPVRATLKQLQDEMVEVGQAFNRNIREDVRTIEADPKELDGVPEDFLKSHKPNDAGKILITTNYPDFFPVETYAKSEALRKRLMLAFLTRAAPKNDAVLKRLLELRSEYSKILGYPSWAQYQAEDKMVKSAPAIEKFINDLAKLARPRMKRDLKELLARKRKDDPKAKSIDNWDRLYYVDRVRSERYGFDSKAVRPYFEFNSVLKGLFDLYGELFGLRFERTTELPVWHESVIAYYLYSGSERIGYFYLDLHPRDGKYGHAAMFNIVTGLSNGQVPSAALVCNFPDPSKTDGEPALMEHTTVRTFFHEFGHLIHHLLARGSKWVNLSGINVEWDFVEAPSQLLEEWIWDPAVLARFAKHTSTGETISPELVAKMRAAEELGKGVGVMRQLHVAAMSFELHTRDPKSLDLHAYAKDVQKRYSPYPYVANTYEYASIGHLEGYSSMYYTYQWSLVIAKDIFTRFAKSGLLDPTTAAEYRQKILVPGGMKDAAELVKDFLGRESNLDAYKAWLERDG